MASYHVASEVSQADFPATPLTQKLNSRFSSHMVSYDEASDVCTALGGGFLCAAHSVFRVPEPQDDDGEKGLIGVGPSACLSLSSLFAHNVLVYR